MEDDIQRYLDGCYDVPDTEWDTIQKHLEGYYDIKPKKDVKDKNEK